MNIHPAAQLFKMHDEAKMAELVADIAANGLHEPIKLLGDAIIDGRNRFRACELAGVKPRFVKLPEDTNPWAFSWSTNLRRDVTPDQRYIAWLKCGPSSEAWIAERQMAADESRRRMSEAKAGNDNAAKNREPKNNPSTTCTPVDLSAKPKDKPKPARKKKAEAANVDEGTVARVDALMNARPDLLEKVEDGALSSAQAYSIAKKDTRAAEIADQKAAIENGTAKLPEGVFEVVCMDPPWNYPGEYDPEGNRAACPYPLMPQEDLLALQPPFAKDSVLFLWTTHMFIWDAKALMDHWGFTYKATLVWDKERIGMGHWLRMQCEFCLIGIKGAPTWVNTTWRDVIREARREHSRKPETFYRMVEEVTVGRRLDFFSREPRTGWEAFGNDTAKF